MKFHDEFCAMYNGESIIDYEYIFFYSIIYNDISAVEVIALIHDEFDKFCTDKDINVHYKLQLIILLDSLINHRQDKLEKYKKQMENYLFQRVFPTQIDYEICGVQPRMKFSNAMIHFNNYKLKIIDKL